MFNSSFAIFAKTQNFSVDPQTISGQGDPISPFLFVPLKLSLVQPDSNSGGTIDYLLSDIEAKLVFNGFKYATSKAHNLCRIDVNQKTERTIVLEFPLTQTIIEVIEKNRVEDASFTMTLNFHIGIFSKIDVVQKGQVRGGQLVHPVNVAQRFIREYYTDYHHILGVQISQSHWVKHILPNLGYKAFRIIEIAADSQIIPKEYKKALAELDEAKKYFNNGDYDKTVGHCRGALDAFKPVMAELMKYIPSQGEGEWIQKVAEASNTWLSTLFKATSSFTSKPHHPPSTGHFDRADAEAIHLITLGIVAYIGRVAPKPM